MTCAFVGAGGSSITGGRNESLFGAQSYVNINTKSLYGYLWREKCITVQSSIVCKYQYEIAQFVPPSLNLLRAILGLTDTLVGKEWYGPLRIRPYCRE